MQFVPRLAGFIALVLAFEMLISPEAMSQSSQTGPAEASDQPIFIMPRSGPFAPDTIAVPNARVVAAWARSGHSDAASEAFAHWNEEGAIPPACAVCHSGIGFRDFHGLDGSDPGLPEKPVPVGGVVDCDTCHNPKLSQVTEVKLPSGTMHPVNAVEAACVTCHQGRAAGSVIEEVTADKPSDEVDAGLRFINPHYKVAAAMNFGAYGAGGAHYAGKTYSGRFLHAKPVTTCVSCHDPHTLEVAEETCLTCHYKGEPEDIRIARQSYDGSGNTQKGIHDDIEANSATLIRLIKDYAVEVAGTPIIYAGERHPYFFADANGDNVIDEREGRPVAYNAWTPRLLTAAYNWKFVSADPGVHVHNPHYALELLYDSTADLAEALSIDFAALGLLR